MKAILSKKCPQCSATIIIEKPSEIFKTKEETIFVGGKNVVNEHYQTTCFVCNSTITLWTKKL